MRGKRVLIPRAEVAREILPDQLRERGALVDVMPVYRTVVPSGDLRALEEQVREGAIDAITFTSSSTVRNFVELVGGADEARRLAVKTRIACIGPITAKTAKECGLTVSIMPKENTIPALAGALAQYFGEQVKVSS
jgi:uroporphyrinogen III methyltransferase/synthase